MNIEIIMTDLQDVGPDGWRHVQVSGLADTEQEARFVAQAAKTMFLAVQGAEKATGFHERVPFEYKPGPGGRGWHLFGRYSFRCT